jgi:hypothetical protein
VQVVDVVHIPERSLVVMSSSLQVLSVWLVGRRVDSCLLVKIETLVMHTR